MRKIFFTAAFLLASICLWAAPGHLVILHTNDTHSQVEPDDKDNLGGVARRKVVIDSVRAAEPNTMLIDAGDIVQGTLYFNLYGGEVENKLMNLLGYDIRILGNHEFDNGVEELARMLKDGESEFLSTNYDLSESPLSDRFNKYSIREIDGRKIGFIAINLQPKGMISEGNYDGVKYVDAIEAANASAWWLKNVEKCDLVVAVTHIGYDPSMPPGDIKLATESLDIDIIIGGHSHDLIDPSSDKYRWQVPNKNGREVIVAQVGKSGKNIGKIDINLDDLSAEYSVIPINSRLDGRTDPAVDRLIEPYRAGIDSLMARPIGRTALELAQTSPELLNFATDIVLEKGRRLADNVDFALLNKGGIRRGLPKGTITEGQVITMLPFNNRVRVIDISGRELIPAFDQMARVGGNGVSKGVEATYTVSANHNGDKSVRLKSITVNGEPLDPDRTYRVATIDYMANGGDYMPTLANSTQVAESTTVLYNDVLEYIYSLKNKKINPDGTVRFKMVE